MFQHSRIADLMVPRSVNDMRGTEDDCNGPNPTTERQDARVLESVSEKALGSTNCKNVFAWCASLKNTVPPDSPEKMN